MALAPGTRLGPYEIASLVGAGGMGEVYRARDLRLQRDVAVKTLSPTLALGEEGRARFEQEAQAAARLAHPNILSVFDVGVHEGTPYIITELLEGRGLRDVLTAGAVPIHRAVQYAMQIADGLAAAHERGIVHRDLKPENLFVTADGRVKVLDFGIAKLTDMSDRDGSASTRFATDVGVVVGTVGYMSPEQVRGESIDHRSDLFSLGAVLYEMLTGRPAFSGATAAETMAAVLRDEPTDPLPDREAGALIDLVWHCLEKRPADRFQTARDLSFALRAFPTSRTEAGAGPRPGDRSPRRVVAPVAWAVGGAGLIALASVGIMRWSSDPVVTRLSEVTQVTYDSGVESFPSLSSDGSWVVYAGSSAGNADVYLRNLGGRSAVNLTATSPADDGQPVLSPDEQQIAFRSERDGGGIFVMGRMGESPRRLTRTGFNPDWSPDGQQIVFASEGVEARPDNRSRDESRLSLVNVLSGTVRTLVTGDAVQPVWSPAGKRIAYWGLRNRNQRDLWTVRADGTDPVPVTNDHAVDWSPTWSPDGRWLYFSSDRGGSMNLWRIRIDEETGLTGGTPEPVMLPALWVAHPRLSSDGRRLAFSSYVRSGNLRRMRFDPAREVFVGVVETLTSGSQFFTTARPSPDGQLLAFPNVSSTGQNIFISTNDGKDIRQVTFGRSRDATPNWSPDGARLAFHSSRDGGLYRIWVVNADGSELRPLTEGTERGWSMGAWSPDGNRIVAYEPITYDAFVIDARPSLSRSSLERLPRWDGGEFMPQAWSPDGRWIAGQTPQGGIVAYSVERRSYQSLSATGSSAQWLVDSRRVLFNRGSEMVVVDIVNGTTRSVTPPPAGAWASGDRSRPLEGWVLTSDGGTAYRSMLSFESDLWVVAIPGAGQ
jgi:eukaryotic-like serine/threonine-protein kinase